MICPACDEIFPPESFGEPKCCPACGAYYEKALKLRAARKAAAAEVKVEKQAQPISQKTTPSSVGSKIDNVLHAVVAPTVAKPIANAHNNGQPLYKGALYCTSCGAVGGSKRHVPGSIMIEIVLWLCFLIPGLIYTLWRYAASKKACKVCSQPTLIPASSPLAQKMLKQ